LLPGVGFSDLLDDGVALAQKLTHVAAKNEVFGDPAEWTKRGGESKVIAHLGSRSVFGGGQLAEMVVVLHGAKGAAEHCVLKVAGWVEGGNDAGEVLADEEVAGAPGDGFSGANEAGTGSGGGLLAEVGVAKQMDFDGAREVEDASERGADDGGFVELDHGRA